MITAIILTPFIVSPAVLALAFLRVQPLPLVAAATPVVAGLVWALA